MITRCALFLLLPLAITSPSSSLAAWQADGNPVTTALVDQVQTVIVSDGSGGVLVAWADSRNYGATLHDIYCQRLSAMGVALWTGNGVALCTMPGEQLQPTIVSDGAGGAIVAWTDYRPSPGADGIYAQHVNASGIPQWTAGGLLVNADSTSQDSPVSVSDAAGGAIIVWHRSGYVLYAQRVNGAGGFLWASDGVNLSNSPALRSRIISDGAGGAIVAWEDLRNELEGDVFTQRVNSSGVALWTPNGVALCTATSYQTELAISADAAGGAFVAWKDQRAGQAIYAQKVNASGTPQWTADGVNADHFIGFGSRGAPTIVSDTAGGAIVAWQDDLNGGGPYDIAAQRITSGGTRAWSAGNQISVCNATNDQTVPKAVPDGAGGAIITWQDQRALPTTSDDIYAQRVNSSGVRQWAANGIPACDQSGGQWAPEITSDGGGGALIAWTDLRTANITGYDVYATRIGSLGLVPTGVDGAVPSPSLIVGNAYPNPFSNTTSLDIALKTVSDVKVDIVDVSGRRVRRIMLRDAPRGALRVDFDGRNDRGASLANGVYFCKVSVAGATVTRRLVIIR